MPCSVVVRVITGSESYGAILHTTKTANLKSIPLSAMKVYEEKTYNSTHSQCRYEVKGPRYGSTVVRVLCYVSEGRCIDPS